MPLTRSWFPSSTTSRRLCPELTQSCRASLTVELLSAATTAGVGVITSRASCSCRWKTPRSIPASPGSRSPPTAEEEISIFRSSDVVVSSRSCRLIPNRRRIEFEIQVRATVKGSVAVRNHSSGRDSVRAALSARLRANIFGTCSPTEMCKEVARVKAIAKATAVAAPCERTSPSAGSNRAASAGSPRKPIPIEAIVIPTWQVERYSSMCSSWCRLRRAPPLPSSASCSIFCLRARTSANSAATKTPLISTSSSSATRATAVTGRSPPQAPMRSVPGGQLEGRYFEGRRRSSATGQGYQRHLGRRSGELVDLLGELEVVVGDAALGVGGEGDLYLGPGDGDVGVVVHPLRRLDQ